MTKSDGMFALILATLFGAFRFVAGAKFDAGETAFFGKDPEASGGFLNKNRGIAHRKLESEPLTYREPLWWRAYRESSGLQFKRCKFAFNVLPEDGSECRRMRISEYTCGFGYQGCLDGTWHPDTLCCCSSPDRRWGCEVLDVCPLSLVSARDNVDSNSDSITAICVAAGNATLAFYVYDPFLAYSYAPATLICEKLLIEPRFESEALFETLV